MKKIVMLLILITILSGCNGNKSVYQFEGYSMTPTIEHEQKFVVDKDYYKENEIKRDDIVIFNMNEELLQVKRVIGLPNETILIKDGSIFINEKPLESEYDFTNVWNTETFPEGITLEDDEYFIIGDSLAPYTSKDSRSVGPILKEDILGKVVEIKD